MTKILISTTCRHTTPNEPSGYLYLYDVEKRISLGVSEIIEPPHRDADPNPRGGFRGLKGLSIRNDKIALANASSIFIYNKKWDLETHLWHPSCAGIHDIKLLDDCIWVTSSSNDLVFCFDFDGEIIQYIDLRNLPIITSCSQGQIKPFLSTKQIHEGMIDFRNPRTHDNNFTDSMHVNSLDFLSNGDLIISCGLFRKDKKRNLHKINNTFRHKYLLGFPYKIYVFYEKHIKPKILNTRNDSKNLSSSSMLILINKAGAANCSLEINGVTVPSHSIRVINDQFAIYLNSTTNELIEFNPKTGMVHGISKIGNYFLRGVKKLPDGNLVFGDNNHILHYDFINKKLIYDELLSKNPIEAVFDIEVFPEHFHNPPKSFITHHKKLFS